MLTFWAYWPVVGSAKEIYASQKEKDFFYAGPEELTLYHEIRTERE